ncbi:MAG: DUF2783 domain-containing protein [Hydrogenophaga sp.]|nr:DUF2783 domain-containing protein [Hydrogenophaga sp.]
MILANQLGDSALLDDCIAAASTSP